MSPKTPRRLLVSTRQLGGLRHHYEDVIVALARSGVEIRVVHLMASEQKGIDPEGVGSWALHLAMASCVQQQFMPEHPSERLAARIRELVDVLRYEHPDYAESDALHRRSLDQASPGVSRWAGRLRRLGPRGSLAVVRLLLGLDSMLPPSRRAVQLIEAEDPDVFVATPVLWWREAFMQVDLLKAAARRGIPTAIWIPSWDNLTNKGLLRFVPDRVFVWNETQRDELARYHSVPEDRVVITGAQTFDRWFSDPPAPERSDFLAGLGLEPGQPLILYLGSSQQIAPYEPAFFERWLSAVRSSDDPELANANILVRPHPTALSVRSWLAHDCARFKRATVSIPDGPRTNAYWDEYRAALRHCTVAVGINTSAMIEAAIFGAPVCTLELPEFAPGQQGTLHFQHLLEAGGGLLHLTPTLEEHIAQLGQLIRRDPNTPDERSQRFVSTFVRPHGLDVPAAPLFAAEMLALFEHPSAVAVPGRARLLLGSLISRSALVLGAPLEERPVQSILTHLVASAAVAAISTAVWMRGWLRHSGSPGRGPRPAPQASECGREDAPSKSLPVAADDRSSRRSTGASQPRR